MASGPARKPGGLLLAKVPRQRRAGSRAGGAVSGVGLEIVLVLLLVAANGVLAMAEIAVLSSRRTRLQQRAEAGDAGAAAALELSREPAQFLSTVQVGIALVGILAGAFGGARIAGALAAALAAAGVPARPAEGAALALVVGAITLLSIVFGELVPKRLALANPERIAAALARPLGRLSGLTGPAVKVLARATTAVTDLLGVKGDSEPAVTEEEIRLLVRQGRDAGVLELAEAEMVREVLDLADLTAADLMTPRPRLVLLGRHEPAGESVRKIARTRHTDYPVWEGTPDNVVGLVSVRDLWAQVVEGKPADVGPLLRQPLFIPGSQRALQVLELFRSSGHHVALVVDEYGSVEGLLKLSDILGAVAGVVPEAGSPLAPGAVRREDGSWLLDGLLPIPEVRETLGLSRLPGEDDGGFHTLGGWIAARVGRLPRVTDAVQAAGFRFEVVDMDGRRVDKVLAQVAEGSPSRARTR